MGDGYIVLFVFAAIVCKFGICFCLCIIRRQCCKTTRPYIIDTNAVRNQGFVQTGQANAMPPGGYGYQRMVEPVAPHYQPPVANQGRPKPPVYNEIAQQSTGMNTTGPLPPNYSNATTFPNSTNVSGVTRHQATTSGPTRPRTIPYSATTDGPTNPGTTRYLYTTIVSGPTRPGTTPYSYPATTGGPTRPGIILYQYLATTPYPAGTNSGPQQM